MSDAQAKKPKSRKTQGWEEAGGEFYQESYCSEWEGLPKNTFAITTLLPSKQNRFGTRRRTQTGPDECKTSKFWQPFATNTQKTYKPNDAQFSVLPDLSQVLTDEERIWEEILQIKHMPVSMQQKKDLKNSLQSATKLRLQGFNQFKWKHRKAWKKFCVNWSKFSKKLELWQSSLKHVEGHFGTGVVAYFLFLRWLFFLNCITFMLILVFVILPNVALSGTLWGKCSSNNDYSTCPDEDHSDAMRSFQILDAVQGGGVLRSSFMFYGAYSNETIGGGDVSDDHLECESSAKCEENYRKSSWSYDLALAYIFAMVGFFSIALIAIVRAAAREFKDRLVNGKWQFYQYCNLVFGGWDFCIHNEKSSVIKYRAIFNEIKCVLHSKRIEREWNSRSKVYMYSLVFTRIIVNVAVLTILLISAYLIFFIFNISMKYQNAQFQQLTEFLQLNETNNEIDEFLYYSKNLKTQQTTAVQQQITDLFFDFMPFITIVCLNLFLPIIFNYLCQFEKYSPLFEIKITLFRTIFLRLASLAVLISRFYFIVIPQSSNQKSNTYRCWETFVGQQFYKLVLTDFVSHLLVTFCINLPRAFFARTIKQSFIRFIGEQEFELSKHVLDVIYIQTICWLGSFYSPILPALVSVIMFCMFYVKKFQCLVNSRPSKIFYGASRSNSLFMLILLLSFFVAVIPITYGIAEVRPSTVCGPFRGLHSVWDAPIEAFMKMPTFLKNIFFFFGTAGFAIPCFIVLTLLLYYFYAVSDANRNMVEVLKNQLVLEGHDKQFLLTRLSFFIKHQGVEEKNMHSAQLN